MVVRAVGVAALLTGCLVEVDYGGTRFSCADDGRCPPGFECSTDLVCEPEGTGGGGLGATGRVLAVDNPGAALSGFPLLVRLDASRVDYAAAGDSGEALRFYAADRETLLPHQIERWDPAGESLVWVRVDVAGAATTDVLVTWGAESAPAALPPEQTYDDSFVGVWHLAESPADGAAGAILDHSGADLHATSNPELGAGALIDGAIGNGLQFSAIDSASAGDDPAFELPVYTWSMWLRGDAAPTNAGNGQPMFNADDQFNFSWDHTNPDLAIAATHRNETDLSSVQIATPIVGQTFYMIAATYDGTDLAVYLDGALEASVAAPPPIISDGPFAFGNDPAAPVFSGAVDEVRVSNVARPPDWFALAHRAALDQAITFGAERDF